MKKYLKLSSVIFLVFFLNIFHPNIQSATSEVTLDVSKNNINLYPTYYTYGDSQIECDASKTAYIITGTKSSANGVFNVYDPDSTSAVYNIIFDNLNIRPGIWCAVASFNNNSIVNLHCKGTNYVAGHNYCSLKGSATLNISAEPGSKSTFTSEYHVVSGAIESGITLNKNRRI